MTFAEIGRALGISTLEVAWLFSTAMFKVQSGSRRHGVSVADVIGALT